ncbi:uncharacterized protein LOC113316209 [Papaver somniferum]|uniref:uncharacterized protein LOC113316209 n=1 Tax=Papaver somniferum TaxID=3469 RepID=UPI000E6FCBD1|nr:uncharacterized protein LOC113316209 [Papaver somniferum]
MYNNVEELCIANFFRVVHRKVKVLELIECFWEPPEFNEIMLCWDGVSRGNTGIAGVGAIARGVDLSVLGAMWVGFGIQTNYLAEIFCVIIGLEWALKFGIGNVCIRTYSLAAVTVFSGNILDLPWFIQSRWVSVRARYNNIRFIHIFREANFSVDALAKKDACYKMKKVLVLIIYQIL